MDEREVLAGEFPADRAKFKVLGGGFQDLGNGAKWATRRWMGKHNVSKDVSMKHLPRRGGPSVDRKAIHAPLFYQQGVSIPTF